MVVAPTYPGWSREVFVCGSVKSKCNELPAKGAIENVACRSVCIITGKWEKDTGTDKILIQAYTMHSQFFKYCNALILVDY
jgi:hypothetical protein